MWRIYRTALVEGRTIYIVMTVSCLLAAREVSCEMAYNTHWGWQAKSHRYRLKRLSQPCRFRFKVTVRKRANDLSDAERRSLSLSDDMAWLERHPNRSATAIRSQIGRALAASRQQLPVCHGRL
jgi:hypothetical protein